MQRWVSVALSTLALLIGPSAALAAGTSVERVFTVDQSFVDVAHALAVGLVVQAVQADKQRAGRILGELEELDIEVKLLTRHKHQYARAELRLRESVGPLRSATHTVEAWGRGERTIIRTRLTAGTRQFRLRLIDRIVSRVLSRAAGRLLDEEREQLVELLAEHRGANLIEFFRPACRVLSLSRESR